MPNANAGNLFNAIESNFEHDGIPFKNLIGFGSDGASVMRGTHNSVLSRLKEKQPDIFFLHCICHSAHLCASGACKKLPRNVEKLVKQIYFHFKSSPKRRE